jgi:hypothetical protein
VFQVSLLATGPCSAVAGIFPPPIWLVSQVAHVLPFSVALHVRSVLAQKPRFLSLCLIELIEGDI